MLPRMPCPLYTMQEGSKKWQGRLDSMQVASTPRRTRSKSSCHLALLSTANDDAWISRSLHALQRLPPKSSVARLSGILHPVESGTDAVQVRAALIRIRTFLCVNGGPVFPECSTDAVKELLGSQCARALNHFPRHYDQQMKQEETSTTSTPEYISVGEVAPWTTPLLLLWSTEYYLQYGMSLERLECRNGVDSV